jgi:CheY-like chemotaxis protein/two-component sensor histidine kinase
MVRLIDDLLDISRISLNKLELRRERIQIVDVLQTAVETSRPLIAALSQELTVTIPPERIWVNGDLTRLAQVISNLLNNACKYTEGGGRIWLTAERDGADVVLRVRDTGIGIQQEMLPRIFDMFTQAHESLDQARGGLGIGLTLVKRLVGLHGGTITAASEGPGKGSEFTLRLPIATEVPAEAPVRVEAARPTPAARGVRVLLVDDNRESADSLGILLQLSCFEVRTAYDGLEAVATAADFRPHAALLDIGLPKLNGYDVARRIRQEEWGAGIFLVAATGWGDEAAKQGSREAGFDHHLVKPMDPATLMAMLSSLKPTSSASARP